MNTRDEEEIRNRFKDNEAPISPRVWENIRETLPTPPAEDKFGYFSKKWYLGGLVFGTLLVTGILIYFTLNKETTEQSSSNTSGLKQLVTAEGDKKNVSSTNAHPFSQDSELLDNQTLISDNKVDQSLYRNEGSIESPQESADEQFIQKSSIQAKSKTNSKALYQEEEEHNLYQHAGRLKHEQSNQAKGKNLIHKSTKKSFGVYENSKYEMDSKDDFAANDSPAPNNTLISKSDIDNKQFSTNHVLDKAEIKESNILDDNSKGNNSSNNGSNNVANKFNENTVGNIINETTSKPFISSNAKMEVNDLNGNFFDATKNPSIETYTKNQTQPYLDLKDTLTESVSPLALVSNNKIIDTIQQKNSVDSLKTRDSSSVENKDSIGFKSDSSETKKPRKKHKWSIGLDFMPLVSGISTKNIDSLTNAPQNIVEKNNSDFLLFNLAGGLNFNYQVNNRISLQTGVYYTNFTEKNNFQWNELKDTIKIIETIQKDSVMSQDTNGTYWIVYDTTLYQEVKDTLKLFHREVKKDKITVLSIPLNLQYVLLTKPKFILFTKVGVLANILLNNEMFIRSGNSISSFRGSTNKITLAYSIYLGVEYKLSKTISLTLQPGFGSNINRVRVGENYSQNPFSFNLSTGIKIKF